MDFVAVLGVEAKLDGDVAKMTGSIGPVGIALTEDVNVDVVIGEEGAQKDPQCLTTDRVPDPFDGVAFLTFVARRAGKKKIVVPDGFQFFDDSHRPVAQRNYMVEKTV